MSQGISKAGANGPEQAIMLRFLKGKGSDAAMMGAARYFRKVLSSSTACQERGLSVSKPSLVAALVSCLQHFSASDLQLDACWALTNIACGDTEDTHLVVHANAVPVLVELAGQSKHMELRDQAIWCLSNIAGDCNSCRSRVLREDFVGVLVQLLRQESLESPRRLVIPVGVGGGSNGIDTLHTVVWALSNVCRVPMNHANGKQYLLEAVPLLGSILRKTLNQKNYKSRSDTVADICWTLAYLADGSAEEVQCIVDHDLGDVLMQCLRSREDRQVAGALRAIGNLATSNDAHTQYIVDMGSVPVLANLVGHSKESIRREAVWTISNITAGNQTQIGTVLSERQLVRQLIVHLDSQDIRLQKEASWAVCNAMAGGSLDQKRQLLAMDVCRRLAVPLRQQNDERILCTILEAIDKSFIAMPTHQLRTVEFQLFKQAGGVERIKQLKEESTNLTLNIAARNVWDTYCIELQRSLPDDKCNPTIMICYAPDYPYHVDKLI